MRIMSWLRQSIRSRSAYQPMIEISLSKSNLLSNIQWYQNLHPGVAIAPVLKSNAYGHGLVEIARMLRKGHIPFCAVDSLYEAALLRHQGIDLPLLVFDYTSSENMVRSHLRGIAFAITSLEELGRLSVLAKKTISIHLKIDTGMHRQGLLPSECETSMNILRSNPHLKIEGIFSHLADADGVSLDFTHQQIEVWKSVSKEWMEEFPSIRYTHLSNSAGAPLCDSTIANTIRLGLGLYGIHTNDERFSSLRPVLEMKTILVSLKHIFPGDSVGYNRTFSASQPMRIAVVPVGYFEGVDRRLSNQGCFMVRDTICPIIGRVSMNMTTIDVTHVAGVTVGDRVTVISRDQTSPHNVASIAAQCQTVPHEILVHIPAHLRRTVLSA